jgi:L-xylulokinase
MFADVLDIPIGVAQCGETGALGAAIAAGVGSGLFADLETGVDAMVRRGDALVPDPERVAYYAGRYRTLETITEAMKPIWALNSSRDAG